mgnify:CR=1 FL=1
MGTRKRLKDNTQRGMNRRFKRGRKPMCAEEKLARKKLREDQSAESKARNEKLKNSKKE